MDRNEPDFPTPPSPSITILYTLRPPRVVFDGCAIFDKSPLFSFLPALSSFLFLLFFRDAHPIDSPAIINNLQVAKICGFDSIKFLQTSEI